MSKRFAIISAAVVGAGVGFSSPAADAALLISSTRTPGTTFDVVDFRVSGFTGADLTYVPSTPSQANGVSAITGTFSAAGTAATLSLTGTAAQYATRTSNGFAGTPNQSYANFDSIVASDFSRTPATTTPTSLTGTWYTTGDGSSTGTRIRPIDTSVGVLDDGFDQTLLAEIYVTKGQNVSFAGQFSSYANVSQPLAFSSVPEPASLAALGLTTAAALRRRRV